jgi:hypothetical protein
VTLRLTAHAVGASDDPDLDVLVAGVAEHPDGSGWSLTFQGGSSDRTQADPDEEYCLVTDNGACIYGGVSAVVLAGTELRLALTRSAAGELDLDRRVEITLEVDAAHIHALRDGLARIFAATSIDSRPRRLVLPGSHPAVQGRPLLHRRRPARDRGARVEYLVVARRGALLDVQAVGRDERTVEVAASLAELLGVNDADLVGRRYTCLVVPDRFGVARSDYRLVPD